MELDGLLGRLGWADDAELRDVLQAEWASSRDCRPGGAPAFLSPGPVADACRDLSLPRIAQEALLAAAGRVAADPALSALAWHLHYCAFRSDSYPAWGAIARWPSADRLTTALDADGRTFYLLVLTSGLPGMRAIYEARRIPGGVFGDTLGQLRGELADLHRTQDVWGVSGPDRVQWHRFALRGELFRLGRLVFQFGLFRFNVRVFRHRTSRAVVALSEGGVSYLPSGQADGPGRLAPAGQWTSELAVEADGVTGNPILPAGRAVRRKLRLPAAEWRQVLARDDPALYIHFPGGGPLTHSLCGGSFESAMAFFPRHFPDRPCGCFCCDSWVLDSQLQELLPPTSNMVRLQREMYLLPYGTHDEALVHVVFGGMPEDAGKAPRDTALQRALLDRIARGGRFHAGAGAGFILPEDFAWGRQVYIRQELPWAGADPMASDGMPPPGSDTKRAGPSAGGDAEGRAPQP